MADYSYSGPDWDRKTLEKLAFAAVDEQRRSRRWGVFFKSLTFLYLIVLLMIGMDWIGKDAVAKLDHTALIDAS